MLIQIGETAILAPALASFKGHEFDEDCCQVTLISGGEIMVGVPLRELHDIFFNKARIPLVRATNACWVALSAIVGIGTGRSEYEPTGSRLFLLSGDCVQCDRSLEELRDEVVEAYQSAGVIDEQW
jgi:hypothetical protein